MSEMGQNPNATRVPLRLFPPAADMRSIRLMCEMCRYCCKSRKLRGDKFPAGRQSKPQSPVCVASIMLPRSPVSLSRGDEVSHIFYTKVACTAKRNFDHECKKTFSTASVMNRPIGHVRVGSAYVQSTDIPM